MNEKEATQQGATLKHDISKPEIKEPSIWQCSLRKLYKVGVDGTLLSAQARAKGVTAHVGQKSVKVRQGCMHRGVTSLDIR